jgi:hypothetical protein
MKKMNLTYAMFGVFLLVVITVITCNRGETGAISLPIPEVIIEEVEVEVKAAIKEILPALEEVKKLPEILLPKVEEKKEEPVEAPVEEEILDDVPADTTLTDSLKQEGE